GRDPQPHGGRGHGRDLALAGVAVGPLGRDVHGGRERGHADHRRPRPRAPARGDRPAARRRRARGVRRRPVRAGGRARRGHRPHRALRRLPHAARVRGRRRARAGRVLMTAAPGAGRALGFDEDGVAALHATLDGLLAPWDAELEARYPGDDGSRQPVHTVYVPGDRYTAGLAPEWAARAREAVDAAGGGTDGVRRLVDLLGVGGGPVGDLADAVAERVRAKLAVEAIEDLRIDFEDGFGDRGDAAEDAAVTAAARE